MAAFARDLARERSAQPPPVPVSVRAETIEMLDDWPADAVLGWLTPDGPLALPARWDAEGLRGAVVEEALAAAGQDGDYAVGVGDDEFAVAAGRRVHADADWAAQLPNLQLVFDSFRPALG